MTVTLNLPEKIARHLLALDEIERDRYATAAFSQYDAAQSEDASDYTELIAGVREGLSDAESGRSKPLAQYIDEQRAWWQERNANASVHGK